MIYPTRRAIYLLLLGAPVALALGLLRPDLWLVALGWIALVALGLGVPEAAELCGRLRAAGLQLPDDLFTQEELHDHLLRLWKEKQEKEAAK